MTAPLCAIWFRKNGGDWNDDPTADPSANVGGVDLSVLAGQMLYATAQGTGDALQSFNFAGSFVYSIPVGFMPGWPNHTGGWTSFDPSTAQGSVVLTGSNLTIGNPVTPGLCQVLDGWDTGKFYFEYTNAGEDLFTSAAGGGMGRLGVNLAEWFGGGFSGGDNNGGGVCVGGFNNTWVASIRALGAIVIPAPFTYMTGDVISVAVIAGPPPAPPAVLNMGEILVTSLATESPCTAVMFDPAPTVTPSLGLRWSDTRGATWGNPVPQPLTSDPLSQPRWNRTGYARDRVFELFWSSAFKTALNGAFIDVVPWKS